MLVGGVVHHHIHDQPQAALVHLRQQQVEVLHGAILAEDPAVVADVVAGVLVGAVVHGREPHGAHPEPFDIVEFLHDPADVADPVPV